MSGKSQLTVIDLFSGCGGMSWGLHKAGFKVLAGIDHWAPAVRTFQYNHPDALAIEADLTQFPAAKLMSDLQLKSGELDCLIGGPPCQGFSKNVRAADRFLLDPRNQLFREFLAYVEVFLPKTIVMENVAELYNAYDGTVRDEVISTLENWGYSVDVRVIYMPDYGVPQRRRRCVFFGSTTGVSPQFPNPTHGPQSYNDLFSRVDEYLSAWDAISDLPILQNGEGHEPMPYDQPANNAFQEFMRRDSSELFDHITRKLNEKQFSRVLSIGPGQGLKDLPVHLQTKGGYSGAYGRLDFSMIAPTITRWVFHPGSGRYCHPREERLITIREAARVQSFTDDYRFTGTYIEKSGQVGNAVPPMLMYRMADSIKACCANSESIIFPEEVPV